MQLEAKPTTLEQALAQIEDLCARLEEAEGTLRAITSGEVDAVVVSGPEGEQIYTLVGAERTYRLLVEAMNEGALILSPEGLVLYSNRTFAAMLGAPLGEVIGASIYDFIDESDVQTVGSLLQQGLAQGWREEVNLKHENGSVPASVSVGSLEGAEGPTLSAVVTDLTEHKRLDAELSKHREHLEYLVVERTRELLAANEQLQVEVEARKTAEDSLRDTLDELRVINEELHTTNQELHEEIRQRARAEADTAEARARAEEWAARLESFVSGMVDGVTLFDADGKAIMMNDAGRALLGVPPDAVYDDWLRYERYTLDGDPIRLDDTASFRALRGEMIRDLRYRVVSPWGRDFIMSVSAAPVMCREGRIIGATNVFRDVTDQVEFERRQQELFEREHRISEALQQALIPSEVPYDIRGISIATRYQPALKEAEVGGDFYDVFELGGDKIGVLIGDVAGKGLRAAIRVAAARYAIRSYAYIEPSPGRVLTLANRALYFEDPEMESMLTGFFAVVDAAAGTMTYACAGHEPPVVCRHGEVEELDVTGTLLGAISGAVFTDMTLKLAPGENVVMFTDGITEARRHPVGLFGKEGVIEHLKRVCDAPPDEVAGALLQAAVLHAGGALQDDAAIVVLGLPADR